MTDIEAIAPLRDQLPALLSLIDTGDKPRPDKIHPDSSEMPGPEWCPAEGWMVRCVDDDVPPPTVFINPPGLFSGGDLIATRTTEARRIATAILAACDWTDGLASGVTQLDARRPA